jgi:hypothetical protein
MYRTNNFWVQGEESTVHVLSQGGHSSVPLWSHSPSEASFSNFMGIWKGKCPDWWQAQVKEPTALLTPIYLELATALLGAVYTCTGTGRALQLALMEPLAIRGPLQQPYGDLNKESYLWMAGTSEEVNCECREQIISEYKLRSQLHIQYVVTGQILNTSSPCGTTWLQRHPSATVWGSE